MAMAPRMILPTVIRAGSKTAKGAEQNDIPLLTRYSSLLKYGCALKQFLKVPELRSVGLTCRGNPPRISAAAGACGFELAVAERRLRVGRIRCDGDVYCSLLGSSSAGPAMTPKHAPFPLRQQGAISQNLTQTRVCLRFGCAGCKAIVPLPDQQTIDGRQR